MADKVALLVVAQLVAEEEGLLVGREAGGDPGTYQDELLFVDLQTQGVDATHTAGDVGFGRRVHPQGVATVGVDLVHRGVGIGSQRGGLFQECVELLAIVGVGNVAQDGTDEGVVEQVAKVIVVPLGIPGLAIRHHTRDIGVARRGVGEVVDERTEAVV